MRRQFIAMALFILLKVLFLFGFDCNFQVHYVYLCRKRKDADLRCKENFEKVIEELIEQEKIEEEYQKEQILSNSGTNNEIDKDMVENNNNFDVEFRMEDFRSNQSGNLEENNKEFLNST